MHRPHRTQRPNRLGSPKRGLAKVRAIEWSGESWGLAFSPSGAYVVTRASIDADAELWDANAHRRVRTFTPPVGIILALRDDGRFIAINAGDRTWLVDTENGDTHAGVPITAVAAAFGANNPSCWRGIFAAADFAVHGERQCTIRSRWRRAPRVRC